MKRIITIITAAFTVTTASAASSQTTIYKGFDPNTSNTPAASTNPNSTSASQSFQNSLTGTRTESFESFPTGTSAPLVLSFTGSSGTLNATLIGAGDVASATRANPTSSGQFATDGNKYYEVESGNFGINFANPVAAFGFFATDIESDLQLSLTHLTGASELYSFNSLFGTDPSTPSGSVNFLGLINTSDPFTSVNFGQGANSGGDIFAFDQLTIGDAQQVVPPVTGAVPEPASWAMMIIGFGLIGAGIRYRQRRTVFRYA